MKRKTTVVRLPHDLLYCIKAEALRQGTSMNQLILHCILECQARRHGKRKGNNKPLSSNAKKRVPELA